MKITCKYFDNDIEIVSDSVNAIEIINKAYFIRFINDLLSISNGELSEEIIISNKNIKIYIDYFNMDFSDKKTINNLNKIIKENISIQDQTEIIKLYSKLAKKYLNSLSDIDLPIRLNDEISMDTIIKTIKLNISKQQTILDNILLLIDMEKVLNLNNILFFVNLKLYLSSDELKELYKYSIYNQIHIVLIDSQEYEKIPFHENKLIIDDNLDEFVIK